MSEASNICLSCGLCCDGSLIGFVQLKPEEIPVLKKIMEIEEEGQGFFLQPCTKFCGSCSIYENRPQSCDSFNCGLLKSVEQNDLAFEAALTVIQEVKERKAAIENTLTALPYQLQSKSFYFKMVELKKILPKENGKASQLMENQLKELDKLLYDKFGVTLD